MLLQTFHLNESLEIPWLDLAGSTNHLRLYKIQSLPPPPPPPQAAKKKNSKKGKKMGWVKAAGVGLEDFVDLVDQIAPTRGTQGVRPVLQNASELAEESEDGRSNLAAGFATWIRK